MEEKLNNDKSNQSQKENNRTNWWLRTCAATYLLGMYTHVIDWNKWVRAGAHLTGAFAVPAAGAFASSLIMDGIEKIANFGITKYNEKHPQKEVNEFKINPKVKNIIKFASSAFIAYTYANATLGTEADQFAKSGIFQTEQYLADITGSIGGTFAFYKLDAKNTFLNLKNKIQTLSNAIVSPINKALDKSKEKKISKQTSIPNNEKTINLKVEEIIVDTNLKDTQKETIISPKIIETQKQEPITEKTDIDLER